MSDRRDVAEFADAGLEVPIEPIDKADNGRLA